MKLKAVQSCTVKTALSILLVISQFSQTTYAGNSNIRQPKTMDEVGLPLDLFPIDTVQKALADEDVQASDPGYNGKNHQSQANGQNNGNNSNNQNNGNNNRNGNNNQNNNGGFNKPRNNNSTILANDETMEAAKVPNEFKCPLFDNRPNAELIRAIDALVAEVTSNPECQNNAAASNVESNSKTIKTNIDSIRQIMQLEDPSMVNVGQIESAVTAAINATQELGNTLNNNAFINSKCGRQTMSSGQALLALNDIINGVSPYALMAVSLNAALLPALPYVIGTTAVSSAISIGKKMYESNTISMQEPDHRKALLQNTCQFVKVAKKVRFMELAQSGQIEQITQELDKKIERYKSNFSNPSRELYSLLKYKDTTEKMLQPSLAQIQKDRETLTNVEKQIAMNNDDLMMCTLSKEVVNWSRNSSTFPNTIINNLTAVSANATDAQKMQTATLKSHFTTSLKRITDASAKATRSEDAIKLCAQSGKSLVMGLKQSLNLTNTIINTQKASLEKELSVSKEYGVWKSNYNMIQADKLTVSRVEAALEALSKDDSIVDRSELSQRMGVLKSGLFGTRDGRMPLVGGAPPALAWLDYTKRMHDRSMSQFVAAWTQIYEGALTLTTTGKTPYTTLGLMGMNGYVSSQVVNETMQNVKSAENLTVINLNNLPLGSRNNEIACQQLESAWLNWSSALDHIGATKLYCNLIDNVLDVSIDARIVKFCRGDVDLNGRVNSQSTIASAQSLLVTKGYKQKAELVRNKMKELQCPMPSISVMND